MPNSPFATRLSGSAKETELRLRNIFQWKKKRPPIIFIAAAILVVVGCGSLIGFNSTDVAAEDDPMSGSSLQEEETVSAPVPVSAVDATEEVLSYVDAVFASDQVRMLCWLFPGTGPIGVPIDDYYEQVRQVFAQYTWTREESVKIADEEDQNAWHLNFGAHTYPNGFFDIIAGSSDAWICVRLPVSEEPDMVYYSYNGEPGSLNYALADLWGDPWIRHALVSLPETIEDGRTLAEAYADAFRELYLAAGAITDYKLCDLAAVAEADVGKTNSEFVMFMTYQVKPADSAEPCWRDYSVAEDGWVTFSFEIWLQLRDGVWRCVLIP